LSRPDRAGAAAFGCLVDAFTALETAREARSFLSDIATPAEVEALAERWEIARALDRGDLSYRNIAAEIGASTTTVTRVARFLNSEPHRVSHDD